MVCAKWFTYTTVGRMWRLVTSVIIMDSAFCCLSESFNPSLDVASQILLRNHSCSASQYVWYLRVGFLAAPAVGPWIRPGQLGHSVTLITGFALEVGTWPMPGQWVSVLGLLLELLRKRSTLSFGVARLEGWGKKFVVSILQPKAKTCLVVITTQRKAKARDGQSWHLWVLLVSWYLEGQLYP